MDLNSDGHLDILSGSFSHPDEGVGCFQVLWGKEKHAFKPAETLLGSDGKPLIITNEGDDKTEPKAQLLTRPFAVDFDNDGKLDIVSGNANGTFYWFRGEGSGKFIPQAKQIYAGKSKEPLIARGKSDPFLVDWDGDGDLDLLTGGMLGGISYAENTAQAGALPEFDQPSGIFLTDRLGEKESLLKKGEIPTKPSYVCRVWVVDFDGDGKLDILAGDVKNFAYLKEGLSPETIDTKFAEYEAISNAMMKHLMTDQNGDGWEEKRKNFLEKRKKKRAEFIANETRRGLVWLLRQK